jgi:hypothetical protein
MTKFLRNMWQDAEYRFDFAKVTRRAHTELVLMTDLLNKSFSICLPLGIFLMCNSD